MKITTATEFFYYDFLSPEDRESIDLLRVLCPDFANYQFLKCDLYKGSLFGGTNVYFKMGANGQRGMVTTKSNIKLYNLSDYPYNFMTESDRNGSVEKGWTGEVLQSMLNDLLQKKNE